MKRTFIKIATVTTALILCVTLLSSCGILNLLLPQLFNNSAINLGPQDFTTVEYTRPDFEEIHTQFDVFLAKLNQGASELTLTFELSEAYSLFNDAQTMYNVADINYYNDVNDSLAKEESEYCAEEFAKLQIKLTEVYCAIVDSGYESVLLPTWTEDDLANLEIEKKLYDNEYVEIQADIAKIQNDYMQIPSEIKVVHGGKSYTIDEIVDMMQEGQLTDAEYSKHVDSFYAQYANAATPLYLQLVDRNNRIAEKAGYETYAEYAYKHVYYRDYLPSDITKKVYKQVREYIPSLYEDILKELDYDVLRLVYTKQPTISSYDEIFTSYFEEISPQMKEAYSFMKKYNLYSVGDTEGMQQAGFTTYLPSYEMPYLYLYTYGDIDDISSFVHEFGHFYSFYVNGFESDGFIDVSEIQSQANELLFLNNYKLTNKQRTQYSLYKISEMCRTIVEGCILDQFQHYVHENRNDITSPQDLNSAFEIIASKYSYELFYGSDNYSTLWSAITHNFVAPFYYISYAMSAMPAIEIYSISLDDRAKAISIYNDVINEEGCREYLTVLSDNQLKTPFDAVYYTNLSNLIDKIKKSSSLTDLTRPYAYLGLAA